MAESINISKEIILNTKRHDAGLQITKIIHTKKSLFGNDVVEFLDNLNKKYKNEDK